MVIFLVILILIFITVECQIHHPIDCSDFNCNEVYIFPATSTGMHTHTFSCLVAGDCDGLVIYYGEEGTLNIICNVANSCNGIQIYVGDFDPPGSMYDATDMINTATITSVIYCEVEDSCNDIYFSCKGNGVGMCSLMADGAEATDRYIQSSTVECNILGVYAGFCGFECPFGCYGTNNLFCHTGSQCECGDCNNVIWFNDVTYSPTDAPPTMEPTSKSPTTNPTTKQPTITSSPPTTNIPTTNSPTTNEPTTNIPTTNSPTTNVPTTNVPTTNVPTTNEPTTSAPTTIEPSNNSPTSTATTATTATETTFNSGTEYSEDADQQQQETTMKVTSNHINDSKTKQKDNISVAFIAVIIVGCLILFGVVFLGYRVRKKGSINNEGTKDNVKMIQTTNMNTVRNERNDQRLEMVTSEENDSFDVISDFVVETAGNVTVGNVDGFVVEADSESGEIITMGQKNDVYVENHFAEGINCNINEDGNKELIVWLDSIGFSEYYDIFVQNGFDCIQMIKTINNEKDLENIGISLKEHKSKLMNHIKNITPLTDV